MGEIGAGAFSRAVEPGWIGDAGTEGDGAAGMAVATAAVPASEASGWESTTVGLSGEVSATSGGARRSLTTTVTLPRERARVPSGAIVCRTTSCEPGGSGGGTRAKRPDPSARPRA